MYYENKLRINKISLEHVVLKLIKLQLYLMAV